MRRIIPAIVILFSLLASAQDKLTIEQLLAKHLDSIGTADARAAAKARTVNGKFAMTVPVGGTTGADGDAGILTSGRMLKVLVRSSSDRYPGEKVWYDGKRAGVDLAGVGSRTYLGDFLYHNDCILRDGLFAGTIGTSWALLDVKERGAKLTYDGLKEVDGRSLHQVTYVPKKAASELNVRLYFEPDTFRHVMTQYKTEVAPYMNVSSGRVDRQATTTNSAKTTYTITESFDDFQTVDGITLPRKWQLDYKVEPVRPIQMHWVVDWGSVRMNPSLDLKAVFPEM